MLDVLVAGAGPAGAIAGLVLARAGARVVIVDRDAFPRDKLCGDTLNPGAVALLSSLGLKDGPLAQARPLHGMLVSGPHVRVSARYGNGHTGRAILRRDLDAWLLDEAIRAGARFEPGLAARELLMDTVAGRPLVRGLTLVRRDGDRQSVRLPASITIAADGRRSTLARAAGLVRADADVRRWAFGTYATDVSGTSDLGEMHIRRGFYLGIAPITDSLVNVCVVTGPRPNGRTPVDVIQKAIARDSHLADRFSRARWVGQPHVLGPLAVDTHAAGVDGMLLAGDAAGFIDPMTGDGIHLAIRGALLAADEARRVLESADLNGAPERLTAARMKALSPKLRFNRALRRLVNSPAAFGAAEVGAAVAPMILRRLVRIAGDAA